ncbi:hypothetical protein [Acinetobacter chinensis]|uniref:hypothetical protein n=1 Tax=Acinetobacter chinensis TaxID=2004650 RepID=UPI002934F074|nr:hypothetical protein [Acinetobacter chinensis]WOE40054.1 hypothetical protein QSG87_09020 [Acinetobacter chinensis]
MQLLPDDSSIAPVIIAGTLSQMSLKLHNQLMLKGYSLLHEDVLQVFINETCKYAAWQTLTAQRNSTQIIEVDESLVLQGFEWLLIEPSVRAGCDVIQANLVDASGSLGMEHFGLSVSEAEQALKDENQKLGRAAFVQPPLSFKTLAGN